MNRLKFILFGTACVAGSAPALAEESDWSGPYIGVYTGHSSAPTQFEDNWCWASCDAPKVESNSAAAGATIGYNLQVDPTFIVGIEADVGTGGSESVNTPNIRSGTGETFTWKSKIKWSSTVRLRAGLAHGRTIAYVTGGVAFADADFAEETRNYPIYPPISSNWGARWSGTMRGFSLGGGVEHDFGGVTLKGEIIHASYGKKTVCLSNSDGPLAGQCWDRYNGQDPSTISFAHSNTAIRIGANIRF